MSTFFRSAADAFVATAQRTWPWVPVFVCAEAYLGTVKLVGGRSMQPTFNARGNETHDVVVLDRWSARRLAYERGDVVVLRSPHEPGELLTKRVVGLAGDWVRPRGPTPRAAAAAADAADDDERAPERLPPLVHVPRGQVWVEGDNAASSNDSNSFGAVAAALVEAKVCYKLLPLAEAGPVRRDDTMTRARVVHKSGARDAAAAVAQGTGSVPWSGMFR